MRDAKGSKYDATLDVKDIAKLMRADIQAAIARNALPHGKYSVTIERFSGGRAIRMEVKELEFPVLDKDAVKNSLANPDNRNGYPLSKIGELTKQVLQQIHNDYNYDNSQPETDYFNVNYYGHAEFSWKLLDAERKAIEAEMVAAKISDFNYVGNHNHY